MKGFFSLTFASILVLSAHAQNLTVTEDLHAAQGDLALTHQFVEQAIFINRGQLSAALNLINRAVVNSHIDTFGFIRDIAQNVTDEINLVEVNQFNEHCIEVLVNRWDLQVRR